MKQYKKIFIAVLGATNAGFSIFIPIALTLLLIPHIKGIAIFFLLGIGILSSLYRAIEIGILKTSWKKKK